MATFIENLLRLVVKYDYQEFVFWFLSENDALTPSIECGDVFVWGCADEEDILEDDLPLLEKCFEDTGGESGSNGAALFCARKRGMRPQGEGVGEWVGGVGRASWPRGVKNGPAMHMCVHVCMFACDMQCCVAAGQLQPTVTARTPRPRTHVAIKLQETTPYLCVDTD